MRGKKYFLLCIFVLFVQIIQAQEISSIEQLISKALVIKVTAKTVSVEDPDNNWEMSTSFITIPGRQIKLSLTGNNIDINAYLTPYKKESGQVLLIAQGEMWLNDTQSGSVKYYSDMKNVNINFGEKITYYPLGYTNDKNSRTNIELDIQLFKYKDYLVQLSKSEEDNTVISE